MNLYGDVDYNGTLYVDSITDNDWVSIILLKNFTLHGIKTGYGNLIWSWKKAHLHTGPGNP